MPVRAVNHGQHGYSVVGERGGIHPDAGHAGVLDGQRLVVLPRVRREHEGGVAVLGAGHGESGQAEILDAAAAAEAVVIRVGAKLPGAGRQVIPEGGEFRQVGVRVEPESREPAVPLHRDVPHEPGRLPRRGRIHLSPVMSCVPFGPSRPVLLVKSTAFPLRAFITFVRDPGVLGGEAVLVEEPVASEEADLFAPLIVDMDLEVDTAGALRPLVEPTRGIL
jgi:hypothetical protein